MRCLGEDTIARFVSGALSPRELAFADEHLADCDDCRRVVATVMPAANEPDASAEPVEPDESVRIDRYVVKAVIGEGGMGVVHLARDVSLDRNVALKLLRADRSHHEEARRALVREARAMAQLAHPNVVNVYDVGTFGEQVFVAMELVDGGNLAEWLARTPRTWGEIVAMFVDAGRGLEAAHRVGIIHRDFKPSNVLVGSDGRVRVTDFGLARSLASRAEGREGELSPASVPLDTSLTESGVLRGTPLYMAPEQFLHDRVDARADQFGFCVSLYIALFGERPFPSRDLASLVSSVTTGALRQPAARGDVPSAITEAVCRGLATKPEDRFPSMTELLEALERGVIAPKTTSRRPVLLFAAIGLAVGVGGAFTFARSCAPATQSAAAPSIAAPATATADRHEVAPVAAVPSTTPSLPSTSAPSASSPPAKARAPGNRPRKAPAPPGGSAKVTRPYDDAPMEPSFARP